MSQPSLHEMIAAIRALLMAAEHTPGPYHIQPRVNPPGFARYSIMGHRWMICETATEADARLIAALLNAAESEIAEARELLRIVDELGGAANDHCARGLLVAVTRQVTRRYNALVEAGAIKEATCNT